MFIRKSSRSGTDEERTRPGLPSRVDGTKTLTEVRYASSSSGILKRRTSFSAKPLYLRRSRVAERQRPEEETGARWEKAPSEQAVTSARRHPVPTGGRPELILVCILLVGLVGCHRGEKPQNTWNDLYSSGRTLLELGDKDSLVAAQNKAEQGFRESAAGDPVWNWKFRVLKAEVLVWRGKSADVLALLSVGPPIELSKSEFAVRAKLSEGLAHISLAKREQADRYFNEAEGLASESAPLMLGQVALYRGILALTEERYAAAERQFLKALELAQQQGNHFIETSALSNLGLVSTKTSHFDEAIEYFIKCKAVAQAFGFVYQEHILLSNLLSSYLELGDLPKAVSSYSQEEKVIDSFEPILRKSVFDNLGAVYRAEEDYSASKKYYLKAYGVAGEIQRTGDSNVIGFMAHVQDALAEVALDEGNLEEAGKYGLQVAVLHRHKPAFDLTFARIGIANREFYKARLLLDKIIRDESADASVRWQAQAEMANLYVAQNDTPHAEQQFQKAIASFENAHIVPSNEENKMAFFQRAARVYDQYISLLIAEQKPFAALQVAESNRAHALAEGVGLRRLMVPTAMQLPSVQSFLGRHHYVILAYWLGKERSLAWVVTPTGFQFFTLPARRDIAKQIDQYNRELQHSGEDGLELGQKLYGMLVQPAEKLIPKGSHIAVIADGGLSKLNFETLVPQGPSPHYWIDDVEVENVSSLPLLMRAVAGESEHAKSLLLEKLLMFGAPAKASEEYPPLGHAEEEIKLVEGHFPPTTRTVITGKEATPSAYRDSHPEQYGVIHFATHGTASEISPLDSAIILAPEAENSSHKYKLYAREIIRVPLRAELVTISACSGAGLRTYSGEGLVGLAWSFLRAGAHHVIAGLWDVDDAAAAELMDGFYSELSNNRSPAAALRSAKLAMLHSKTVRRDPYYWASLQLYTGS
jgi:CHAT domain-containing protein